MHRHDRPGVPGKVAGAIALIVSGVVLASCANPAQVEIDRANELLNSRRSAEAFDAFVAALELDPDIAEALAGRGCAQVDRDITAALADLDRAISSTQSVDGYRCRAEARRKTGDLETSLADATKAIEIDPLDPSAHVALGNTLDDLGRTPRRSPSTTRRSTWRRSWTSRRQCAALAGECVQPAEHRARAT